MAEWSKATVLKTVVGFSYRGFESLFIRFDSSSIRANRRVENYSQLSCFVICIPSLRTQILASWMCVNITNYAYGESDNYCFPHAKSAK